jgi:hypothetical protein
LLSLAHDHGLGQSPCENTGLTIWLKSKIRFRGSRLWNTIGGGSSATGPHASAVVPAKFEGGSMLNHLPEEGTKFSGSRRYTRAQECSARWANLSRKSHVLADVDEFRRDREPPDLPESPTVTGFLLLMKSISARCRGD